MIRTAMSPKDRRALVGGAVFLTVVVMSFKVFPAYRRWEVSVTHAAREVLAEVAATERAASVFAEVVDSLEARTERFFALSEQLAAGNTDVRTAGALASWVSLAATEANTKLGSVSVRPDSAGNAVERITITGDLVGDIRGLTDFLIAIEGGELHLAVSELSVDQTDPAGDGVQEELRIRFAVEALLLKDNTE